MKRRATELSIVYSMGRKATSTRAKNAEQSWPEFVNEMLDFVNEPSIGVTFTGSESKDEYDALKKRQKWIGAAFNGVRSNDTVESRSLLFIDLDGVSNKTVRKVTRALEDADLTFLAHGTGSDRHDLKDGKRSVRFLIPTNKPMAADEIWPAQHSFIDMLGLAAIEGMDATAFQRARIMFVPPYGADVWQHEGKPVRLTRLLGRECDTPSETGATNWTDDALANASENSRAIADWAFEAGLQPLKSGRGWALACPNGMAHTGDDGTDGSTAILLPDSLHPEVRFQCQHDHCRNLNSHQHLMLGLIGVPDSYLPEAHNISKKQMAEILPFFDDEELAHWHEKQVTAAAEGPDAHVCTIDDLLGEPCELFTKRDPIIEGVINFKSSFQLVGDSNIGKSFYLLGQMACVAAGIPFAGAKVIKSHCFYFDAEGGSTTSDRKQALQKTYGDDLDWLHIVDIQAEGWSLNSKHGRRSIMRYIRQTAGDEPVGLIAFDSLNQAVSLGDEANPFDENSSSDMGAIASALKEIAEQTGGTAGVVHHPAKSDKVTKRVGRGSGALHGAVDFVYFIEQPDESKPLHLNFYTEKSRGNVKQAPRGFVLTTCKIDVEPLHDEAITRMQSTREAPDFSEFLPGLTVKPFAVQPRDETLVLIPVAVAPFESSAKAAVKQSDSSAKLTGDEKAVYNALEQLQDAEDRPSGFTQAEVMKVCGANGRRRQALVSLAERKVICFGKDNRGQWLNGEGSRSMQFRVPTGPNDLDEPPMMAELDDLDDE